MRIFTEESAREMNKKRKRPNPVYKKHYKTREEIQTITSKMKTDNTKSQMVSSTTFEGETLILDMMSGETKIASILKESFGERA